ncbi:MAG: helix-turn-helix domain-containing protein [Candidatus Limnocylindrales bacterium]
MADMVSHMDDLAEIELRRRRLIARLVGLRKSNGLTQAAVAESMSVGQSVVAEIESGRTDVRVSTLERYTNAVSLGQLQLELVRDAWVGDPVGGVAETLARYGSAVDAADFWSPRSLDDLVGEQGTSPIADPVDLVLEGVSEIDWDDFFATIGIAE